MKKQKVNKLKIFAILEAILILILFSAVILMYFGKTENDNNAVPVNVDYNDNDTQNQTEERQKTIIEKEETLYQLNGEKILMSDSVFGEIYIPVIDGVEKCSYNLDNIVSRNGYSVYKENNEITSILGVDVSKYQGVIDWQKVAESGVEFAILRVGGRTYGSSGEVFIDDMFHQNIQGATAAGIDVGVYFFSQAISVEEAIEEADFVIDTISGYDITYPVVFDWEIIYGDDARTDTVSVDVLTDSSIAFCERVKSAGYTPMIYQNLKTTMFKLDILRLTEYDFWLAQYNEKPDYYYDYKIWQYTDSGIIPGIEGLVDLNIAFKEY